jgi:hypothetical protein
MTRMHFHSSAEIENVTLSVGVYMKNGAHFVTLCARDRVGCQHILVKAPGVLALIETTSRVLRHFA